MSKIDLNNNKRNNIIKNKRLDDIFGEIINIEKINNSKYIYNIYIKDEKGNIYKTLINTRYIGDISLKEKIIIKGVAIKFHNIYKLISYRIKYKNIVI